MHFIYSSNFRKQYKKLFKKVKKQFNGRINIFMKDEFNAIFDNHKLHGELNGYRSINITGDIRLVYQKLDNDFFLLVAIGSHSELYE